MNNRKYRYALTGCGSVAKVHLFHIAQQSDWEICAIHDLEIKKAEEIAELFNVPMVYSEYSVMLKAVKPDAVSVCTPPHYHFQQTMECISQKINVLCEKPLAINYKDGEKVVQAAREKGTVLSVMLPRRFYNNTLAVKKLLEKKVLGDIRNVKYTLSCNKQKDYYKGWRRRKNMAGGGVLMSQAIHCVDRLIYLFGAPKKVVGWTWITRKYLEVEDIARAILEYENGMEILIHANNTTNLHWKGIIEITGSQGHIILDSEKTKVWDVSGFEPPAPEEDEGDILKELKPSYYGPAHGKVIQDFVRAVRGERNLRLDVDMAVLSLKTVLNIYRSAQQGHDPVFMEDGL